MINFYYYTLFFKLVIFFELITYLLSIIRLTKVFNTTLITRFFIVIPALITIFILVYYLKKIRFDFLSFVLVLLVFYGLNMSLFHWQFTESIHYEVYYVVSEISMILFAFFVYTFTFNIDFSNKKNKEYLEKLLDKVSFYILLINTITISFGYIINEFSCYHVYMSLSGKFLLIPFAWAFIKNYKFYVLFTMFLLVLGGKFGVLVAALFMSIFIYKFKKNISTVLLSLIGIFTIIIFLLVFYLIKDYNGIAIIEKINGNYNVFNLDPEKLILFAGGRFIEIFSVFDHFTLSDYLFGKGIGYEYLDILSGKTFIHNVHITPFGLVSKFGLFMTFLLYGTIIVYLFKGSSNCMKDDLFIFFKSILIGMLVFSLTEYAFFVNLIIWVALGYISNRSKQCAE